jgi:hypothetical protein
LDWDGGVGVSRPHFLLLGLFAVLIGVRLRGFVGMHSRLALVTCSGVSVVSGLLVLASLMLFGSLIMMLRGFAAVDRCLFMVFCGFLGHGGSLLDTPDHRA